MHERWLSNFKFNQNFRAQNFPGELNFVLFLSFNTCPHPHVSAENECAEFQIVNKQRVVHSCGVVTVPRKNMGSLY